MARARTECEDWRNTEARMPAAEAFLKTLSPPHLADAPGGQALSGCRPDRGQIKPSAWERWPSPTSAPSAIRASSRRGIAGTADTGRVVSRVGACRRLPDGQFSLGRPALPGHRHRHEHRPRHGLERHARAHLGSVLVGDLQGAAAGWNASRTCTTLATRPARSPSTLPAGGRGYYRTASLTGLWATAPYLHNNSVGVFVKDPSVSARMAAFADGMEKLLWPEKRQGVRSIPVTTTDSTVTISGTTRVLRIPMGTPIDYVARVDPTELARLVGRLPLAESRPQADAGRRDSVEAAVAQSGAGFRRRSRAHVRRRAAGRRQAGAHRVPEDVSDGRVRDWQGEEPMPDDVIFQPLKLPEPDRQEPDVPVEHLRTLRQLRRLRQPGAHQLGSEVRQGRRRRDHLVVRAGASARPHHAQLRHHRHATSGSRSGARSAQAVHEHDCKYILQLSHGGRQRDIPGPRVSEGTELDRQEGSAARVRVRSDDHRRHQARSSTPSPKARAAPARRASTASSCTAPTAT